MHKLTCTEQKAQDNNDVQRSLQQCGKNPFAINRCQKIVEMQIITIHCIIRIRVSSENLLAGMHGLPRSAGWQSSGTVLKACQILC